MWRKGQLSQNAFLISSWSLWVNECAVCPGQGSLLSYLQYGEGCGYSVLRAGMTSVGVGCVTRSHIVSVSHGVWVSVCACPSPVAIKMFSRRRGVHVDTVAVSLFLASIWNFSGRGRRRGDWLAAPQETWASATGKKKKKKKKTTLATAVVWHQGRHSPTAALDALLNLGRVGAVMLSNSAASD